MSPEEKAGVVVFTNGGDPDPGRYVEADGVDGSPPRMPEPDYALTGRGFRLRWVVASAAGMAVAGAVARPLSYVVGGAVGEMFGEIPAEAAIGAVAGASVIGGIGLAQWLLLRRRVQWAALWPVAGALAGANAAAAGFVAFKALSLAGQEALGVAAAFVVGPGAFLAAHWLVLRLRAQVAGRLAIASLGGFLIAAVVTTAVAAASGFEGASPLFGALFGAAYGVVTVVALGRLPGAHAGSTTGCQSSLRNRRTAVE